MRVYTCSPVIFRGGDAFFSRDSGLLCKGLSHLGIEARALLPGRPIEDKDPLLMRVAYEDLESTEFWRGLDLDGLILYSWAAPKYLPIANALRRAGVPFLVNVDSSGLVSRLANPHLWIRDAMPFLLRALLHTKERRSGASNLIDSIGLHRIAKARMKTIEAATVTTAVTPLGALWLKEEVTRLGRSDLSSKIQYLPHPQPDDFAYTGRTKEKLVISVARWERSDWLQKNPKLLLRSLAIFLERLPDWKAVVIGPGATQLPDLLRMDTRSSLRRTEFADFLPMSDIQLLFNRAMIGLWASRGEGQIGAGAQALCCGCSVVAPSKGTLSCFSDYVTRQSGRSALSAQPQDIADALTLEAQDWENNHRSPFRISTAWRGEFAVGNVAKRALSLLGL